MQNQQILTKFKNYHEAAKANENQMDTSFNESNDHKELINELIFDEQNKATAENQAMLGLTTPVKNHSK